MYLHRYCVSVSEEFSAEDTEPFLCYCCFRSRKEAQIESLKNIVETLTAEIQSLNTASISNAASNYASYSDAVRGDRWVTISSSTDPRQAAGNIPQRSKHGEIPLSGVLPNPDKSTMSLCMGWKNVLLVCLK